MLVRLNNKIGEALVPAGVFWEKVSFFALCYFSKIKEKLHVAKKHAWQWFPIIIKKATCKN